MVGLLFAALCWAAWYLSPHNVSLLEFNREAIGADQWWRLWSAHFMHANYSQLLLNSGIIGLMGLMLGRFTRAWLLLLSLLIAMPIMTGLLLLLMPDLNVYRGAFGVAAMMVMMTVWFLILESKRFSLGYWLGVMLLLLFVARFGLETWMMLSASNYHIGGLHVTWWVQCFGVLLGLAFFNALHQSYLTRVGKYDHYRGASDKLHRSLR